MELRCIECGAVYAPDQALSRCTCGGLLDVQLTIDATLDPTTFDQRLTAMTGANHSGVWRYRELLPPMPDAAIVSIPEGNTNLYDTHSLAEWAGMDHLVLKHEGENPTGSFKDRGMTVATSHARWIGAQMVACASTGNTSASVAAYAARAGIPAIVFIPEGKISAAKLGQTIAYGATIVQIRGDFDAAMRLVQDASTEFGIYLLNSINPFRIEGQKAITFELLHQLSWRPPDWIVMPGGNLGNTAAVGKALVELREAGIIQSLPRVAVIQAEGASPFYESYRSGFRSYEPMQAETIASAIRIGDPVSLSRARRTIETSNGVVEAVSDADLLDAKAMIDRAGIGCEPASATTLAGIRKLRRSGVINASDTVAGVLTGHVMKDTDVIMDYHLGPGSAERRFANRPVVIDPTLSALKGVLADAVQR